MHYIIVSLKGIAELIFAVQSYLDDGWEPIGGMIIETLHNTNYYHQTLVKK